MSGNHQHQKDRPRSGQINSDTRRGDTGFTLGVIFLMMLSQIAFAQLTPQDGQAPSGLLGESLPRTATTTALNERAVQLETLRETARVQHGAQLTGLITDLNEQQIALAEAKQRLANGEANLTSYEEGETFFESLGDALLSFTGNATQGSTARANIGDAQADIARLESQIAGTQDAMGTKQNEIVAFNDRIDLELRKADPVARQAEENNRLDTIVALTVEIRTQLDQIDVGRDQFAEQNAALDAAIVEARAAGADEIADRFEDEKELIQEAQVEWRARMDAELQVSVDVREDFLEENANDGVGVTTIDEIYEAVRERDSAGADASFNDLIGSDERAVASTEESATEFTSGAVRMPDFNSILDGIDSASTRDFLLDLQEDEVGYYEFSLRMGSYTKGVSQAAVDAATDLFVLVKEGGDLAGESFEAFLEANFGIRSDVFGDENIALLQKIKDNVGLLSDMDNPEGRRLAEELQQLASNVAYKAQRRIERQAAEGDVHATLEDVGYVAGTVVGVEEVGVRVLAGAVRGTTRLWRVADVVEDVAAPVARAADAAADAERAAAAAARGVETGGGVRYGESPDGSPSGAGDGSTVPDDGILPIPQDGRAPGVDPDIETVVDGDGTPARGPPTGDDPHGTLPPPVDDPHATLPPPVDDPYATLPPPSEDGIRTEIDVGLQDDVGTVINPDPEDGIGTLINGERAARSADELGTVIDNAPPRRDVDGIRTGGGVVRVEEIPGSTDIILHRDGYPPIEAKYVAEGSTTMVYEVPGRPDLVVKLTKPGAATALDTGGYNVINRIDPDGDAIRVPQNFEKLDASGGPQGGGTVTVAERAPQDFRNNSAIKAADGGMTPGQHRAYRRGLDKLNDEGFVWADNKHDNYTFDEVPPPGSDDWVLVVVDPGAIIPMNGLDPGKARELQRAIDDLSLSGSDSIGNWRVARAKHQEWLAEHFDEFVNWKAIQDLTGKPYQTLDLSLNPQHRLPYNPMNGYHYGGLNGAPGSPGAGGPGRGLRGRGADAEVAREGTADASLASQARDAINGANVWSGDYTGLLRNPVRTGDDEAEDAGSTGTSSGGAGGGSSTDSLIGMGGNAGFETVEPIYFGFGPGTSIFETGGIYTNCSPCNHYVTEYYAILESGQGDTAEGILALLMLKNALALCEEFYCPTSFDPTVNAVFEFMRVIHHFGNAPFDPLNLLGSSGGSSSSSSGSQVTVLQLIGGGFARLDQFSGTSNDHSSSCGVNHYHFSNVISSPVIACDGNSVGEGDSSGCGFGSVANIRMIPASECPN